MPSFSFANEKVTFVFQGRQHWPFCDQPKERKVRRIQGNARWLYPCLVLNNCLRLHFCFSSSTLMLLVLQVIVRNAQGSDERDINVNIMGERTCLLVADWTKSKICICVLQLAERDLNRALDKIVLSFNNMNPVQTSQLHHWRAKWPMCSTTMSSSTGVRLLMMVVLRSQGLSLIQAHLDHRKQILNFIEFEQ